MTPEQWRKAWKDQAAIVHRNPYPRLRRLLVPVSGPMVETLDVWTGYAVPVGEPDHPAWMIEIDKARLATAEEVLTGEVGESS